jgi:superfamily II DNA/RNA helicase
MLDAYRTGVRTDPPAVPGGPGSVQRAASTTICGAAPRAPPTRRRSQTTAPGQLNRGALRIAATTTKRRAALSTFHDLGVIRSITDALDEVGITDAFPIQELTLPIALTGTDVIGQARTGTGKTLAFGIPILQRRVAPGDDDFADLAAPGAPQALVIVPTRELCVQVTGDLELAGKRRGARVTAIYGGRAYEPQVAALKAGVEVVVGTPGRLLDLRKQRHLDLSHVKCVVLDEADEMLDLGFLPDV